jgi:hypothetical protein
MRVGSEGFGSVSGIRVSVLGCSNMGFRVYVGFRVFYGVMMWVYLLLFYYVPVEDPVVLEALPLEQVPEYPLQIPIVRTVLKPQTRAVREVVPELCGVA